MGASDGAIGTMTKVIDHGPASSRWNMVIFGDGYRASELAQYHTDVENFINAIYNTVPFNERWCGVNVYRVDVTSTDSGADDPASCSDGSVGTGASRNTFFDATFCGDGATRRLLTVDGARAKAAAVALVPQVHVTVVIINDAQYGGAGDWGNRVATCSTNPSSAEIAIHEIGHAAFTLHDEYGGTGAAPAVEPWQPNVTINTNGATLKWATQVPAGTPIPTQCAAGCASGCTPPATPVVGNPIGLFEGAVYTDCGAYRPRNNCKMRELNVAFCAVCQRVIRDTLAPFMPPESITLTTPSISFANVPTGVGGTGVTYYRAITFEIASCTPKTFRITAGPTGGFGTPFGTVVSVPVSQITTLTYGRVWLSYTSTTPGATASGTVTVRCDETGQTWVINISANTVARPKSAVVLVLDRSYSMTEDAGNNRQKTQLMREAGTSFFEVMLEGDGIGLVSFDDQIARLMDITDVGPVGTGAGRTTATMTINGAGLDPRGATSIGGGIAEGRDVLNDTQAVTVPPYDVTAMVVLTDGMENTPPMISSVSGSINANTFAIGFGLPSNLNTSTLNAITQSHNGYLLVTGTITPSIRTRLQKYFLQILAGITNANVILDPSGLLVPKIEHRIPFQVTEADMGFDAIVLSPLPRYITFELETPDGQRINPGVMSGLGTGEFVAGQTTTFYRAGLPAIPADPYGSHAGTWYAVLSLSGRIEREFTRYQARGNEGWTPDQQYLAALLAQGQLPYDLLVHTYSNLSFTVSVQQADYQPGTEILLFASLREYDVPVENRASVWAEITLPQGSQTIVKLDETMPGDFSGKFTSSYSGLYTIRIRAQGETFQGTPFTREQTRTAYVVTQEGGDNDQPQGGGHSDELICQILKCLRETGAFSDRLRERLKDLGIDLDALLKCMEEICQDRNVSRRAERKPTRDFDAITLTNMLTQMDSSQLKTLVEGVMTKNR